MGLKLTHPAKRAGLCYRCTKKAHWRCDFLSNGVCDNEMCEDHFVPEFADQPPSETNREPYTLCLDHAYDQKLGQARN